MQRCTEIRDFLAACHDGDLDAQARAQVESHLAECPGCRLDAQAQLAARQRLRALKRRTAQVAAPPHIWANASRAWNRQDAMRSVFLRLRYAAAAACVLLLAFSVVWARLAAPRPFPVSFVLDDYRRVTQAGVAPELNTDDADRAASWLRQRIRADVPPLNLSLSNARLLGADVLRTSSLTLGRLLYRDQDRTFAVYVAPGGTRFPGLAEEQVEGREFSIAPNAEDVGLFGWRSGPVGYGLVIAQPLPAGATFALDAYRASERPLP